MANTVERGKAKRIAHDERLEEVVESARNDVMFETGVHYHYVCIKPPHCLGQACRSKKFPNHSVPFSRVVSDRRCRRKLCAGSERWF